MDSFDRFRWIQTAEAQSGRRVSQKVDGLSAWLICRQTIWTFNDENLFGLLIEGLRAAKRNLRAVAILYRAEGPPSGTSAIPTEQDPATARIAFVGREAHIMHLDDGPRHFAFDRTLSCLMQCAMDVVGESHVVSFTFESVAQVQTRARRGRVSPSRKLCRALFGAFEALRNYRLLQDELKPSLAVARRAAPEVLGWAGFLRFKSAFTINAASALESRRRWRSTLTDHWPISHVFLSAWYFPDAIGLICAAHELGTQVLDVQHGQQGAIDGMYCGWNALSSYEDGLPDYFWVWNRYTAENIRSSSAPGISSRLVVGGRCLAPATNLQIETQTPRAPVDRSKDRTVLVALQQANRDAKEPVPPQVLEYLQRLSPTRIIVKPHPAMTAADLESALGALSGLPFLLDVRPHREPLALSMQAASLHLTSHSSSVFDAIRLRVPSVLWGALAGKQFRAVLDAGLAWEIVDAPTSWERIWANSFPEAVGDFELEDLDATRRACLEAILGERASQDRPGS